MESFVALFMSRLRLGTAIALKRLAEPCFHSCDWIVYVKQKRKGGHKGSWTVVCLFMYSIVLLFSCLGDPDVPWVYQQLEPCHMHSGETLLQFHAASLWTSTGQGMVASGGRGLPHAHRPGTTRVPVASAVDWKTNGSFTWLGYWLRQQLKDFMLLLLLLLLPLLLPLFLRLFFHRMSTQNFLLLLYPFSHC